LHNRALGLGLHALAHSFFCVILSAAKKPEYFSAQNTSTSLRACGAELLRIQYAVTQSSFEKQEIAMATKLKCEKCGFETAMPAHCNRPMHLERIGNETRLVCWMGPNCGVADLPKHCGAPMHTAA
jgi:hypothetical protein